MKHFTQFSCICSNLGLHPDVVKIFTCELLFTMFIYDVCMKSLCLRLCIFENNIKVLKIWF